MDNSAKEFCCISESNRVRSSNSEMTAKVMMFLRQCDLWAGSGSAAKAKRPRRSDCGIVERCPVTHLYHLRREALERRREIESQRTSEYLSEGAFHAHLPPSFSLYPSSPLLRRKQQFTSFIRRHERMKNGGSLSSLLSSRHHPLPSLALPPARARLPCMTPSSACVDTCCARARTRRTDGALIGSQV